MELWGCFSLPDNPKNLLADLNHSLDLLQDNRDLASGISVAQSVLALLIGGPQPTPQEIIDEGPIKLPNAERQDVWFHQHPWMRGERAAFELANADWPAVQAKFYWLQKKSREHIAGAVHFTRNWEDHDFTRTDGFKLGIDFFLSANGETLLVVLSNRGNLRVVELHQRLSATQYEIFSKWHSLQQTSSIEQLHAGLWETFKLQSVNEEFYLGVSDSFNDLLHHLARIGKNQEDAKLFSSRLLGRIIFVWFLNKMAVIDEASKYFQPETLDSTTYYKSRLERLFFFTLNKPVGEREEIETAEGVTHLDLQTPYLNGGLFSPQESDWFEDPTLTFPDGFFDRLFNHFSKFNFTTDESSPEYEQVAIDPEMLGRVFESLLATQLSETGDSARKAKGAYYTPREIVAFMARESLRTYLKNRFKDIPRADQAISKLLDTSDQDWAIAGTNSIRDIPTELRPKFMDALDELRAIDPACGSGAFPMGLLQLLYRTYSRLDSRFDPYRTKLQIVQNNIFGVDVEPMAVEISRLRAWLSLVVEEEHKRVEPLPNLDFKFICANSLVPLDQSSTSLFVDKDLDDTLRRIRSEYFNATSPTDKSALQQSYSQALAGDGDNALDDERTRQLRTFNPFDDSVPSAYFDAEHMFGVTGGFDIVLGNPPYIGEKGHREVFSHVRASSLGKRFYLGKMDYFYFFFHLGLDLLREGGCLAFITTNYFVTATYARKLVEDIKARSTVLRFINFGETRIFESAAGQHNMITLLVKGKSEELARTSVVKPSIKGKVSSEVLVSILEETSSEVEYYEIPQSDLYLGSTISLSRSNSNPMESILESMLKSGLPLDQIVTINQGIISGADKVTNSHRNRYGYSDESVGDGIFVLSTEEVDALGLDEHERAIIKPFFKNSDVEKYWTKTESERWIIFADKRRRALESRPRVLAHLSKHEKVIAKSSANAPYLHRPRSVDFERPKIVAPQRSMTNTFGLSSGPWYASADIYYLSPPEEPEFPTLALLGVLNSLPVFCWLYLRGKRKGAMLELYQVPLGEIPIPRVTASNRAEIEKLATLANSAIARRSESAFSDISDLETQINAVVGHLYGLTGHELEILEEWFREVTNER